MFNRRNKKKGGELLIRAPLAGEVVPMGEVGDPTFSENILGRGVAIRPARGRVVSPVDGTVTQMFGTGHAVSLTSADGLELLVHVGLDTVALKGAHFTPRAQTDDKVKAGDLLLEFDLEAIAAAGYDTVTPIVLVDADTYASVQLHTGGPAEELDEIIRVEK